MSAPSWLATLVQTLTKEIFKAEDRRLQKEALGFVTKNAKLGGPRDGFFFQGVLFSDLDPRVRAKGDKGNLHASLVPSIETHSLDRKTIEFDKMRVSQALTVILRDCRTPQDVFDAVPNALHETLRQVMPGSAQLTRTRQEAWTVLDNPRAFQQYQKLRDKLEFYNIAKLLY